MVRFNLFFKTRESNMKVEFPRGDSMQDFDTMVHDYFGNGNIVMNGYRILDGSGSIDDSISDGDTVEVIPDPETYFRQRMLK